MYKGCSAAAPFLFSPGTNNLALLTVGSPVCGQRVHASNLFILSKQVPKYQTNSASGGPWMGQPCLTQCGDLRRAYCRNGAQLPPWRPQLLWTDNIMLSDSKRLTRGCNIVALKAQLTSLCKWCFPKPSASNQLVNPQTPEAPIRAKHQIKWVSVGCCHHVRGYTDVHRSRVVIEAGSHRQSGHGGCRRSAWDRDSRDRNRCRP